MSDDINPHLQQALTMPADQWFTVTDLTGGTPDTQCWRSLRDAATAHYVRPGNDLLICSESADRFMWLAKTQKG